MPFVPLKLPPGMVRPGTRYDAKGRWYDGNLVRWHEQAMQPVGGWQVLQRTDDAAVHAAIADDGGSLTDYTDEANDATPDDVELLPAAPAANDAFYIGFAHPFAGVQVKVSTAASDGVVTWEYYNGAWVPLGASDDTVSFTTSGSNIVSWDLPDDWQTTTVNSQGPFYYVRARVTTAGTTAAKAEQIWVGDGPVDVGEVSRGMLAWRANDGTPHLAIGTPTKLYVFASGVLADYTPAGFTTGGVDAALTTALYGAGAYGSGPYGTGDVAQASITEANTWQLDTFGEDLVACAYSDGNLYTWDKSGGSAATAISNAPTSCKGVVVTEERFVVALGADGDARKVQWSDQEDMTTWAPAATNQAGDFTLATKGQILAGRRGRQETLIWTDVDLWSMRYIGGALVYSFAVRGENCGAISRRAMAVFDGSAAWMGHRSFFLYDGFVRPLPCDVGDFVFTDLNRVQASKIWAVTCAEFGEVIWFYPSGSSTEVDRFVCWNFRENHWRIGKLARTAGVDRDAFGYPIMAGTSGVVYQHEVGTSYPDEDGNEMTPFAESGPIEIAQGDNVMVVRQFIPDEKSLGDARIFLYAAMYPTSDETEHGPYTLANPTDARVTARQVRIRVEQVNPEWRYGTPRLEAVLGGLR